MDGNVYICVQNLMATFIGVKNVWPCLHVNKKTKMDSQVDVGSKMDA